MVFDKNSLSFHEMYEKGEGMGETLFIKGKIDIFITRAGGGGGRRPGR